MTDTALSRRGFLGAGLAGVALSLVPSAVRADARVIDALKGGGHVVYFRHAATTWSGIDQVDWPRDEQRLLSEEGIAQSQMVGAAFSAHDIPVGEVLASPFYRCRDMAEIAFGRVEERPELMGLLSDAAGRDARRAYLRGLVTSVPQDGNRIIVSHRSNIAEVAGVALAEGEAVVLRPSGDGFEVLATLSPEDW